MTRTAAQKTAPTPEVIASRARNARMVDALRKRMRQADQTDALDYQESHSPTEAIVNKISAERNTEITRRRALDSRLFDSLSQEQQEAMFAIRSAWEIMTNDVTIRTQQLGVRVQSSRHSDTETERAIRLQQDYRRWQSLCQQDGVVISAALDVIVWNATITSVDKGRGWKAPRGRNNFTRSLDLYCSMRGWIN